MHPTTARMNKGTRFRNDAQPDNHTNILRHTNTDGILKTTPRRRIVDVAEKPLTSVPPSISGRSSTFDVVDGVVESKSTRMRLSRRAAYT
eukprot:m.915602 g.915602  ORF g.915602 m.915602 type:complete len:90 (-) comp23732_c0_seq83:861-1130(-)